MKKIKIISVLLWFLNLERYLYFFRMLALLWLVDAITPTRFSQWVGTKPKSLIIFCFSSQKQPTFKRQPQIYYSRIEQETTSKKQLHNNTSCHRQNKLEYTKLSRQDIQIVRKSPFIKKESWREKYQTMKFQIKSITVSNFFRIQILPFFSRWLLTVKTSEISKLWSILSKAKNSTRLWEIILYSYLVKS